jgi:hypothetical protein
MAAARAKQTFVCFVDGVRTHVAVGDVFDTSDEVVKAHKDMFEVPEAAVKAKPKAAVRISTVASPEAV